MQIAVLLLLLFLGLALPYWDSAPSALFAQDEGDEADELQYFLPFVFARPATSAQAEDTPQDNEQNDLGAGDGHAHDHARPLIDSWPPQPVGIVNVQWLANHPSDSIVAAQVASDQAEQIAQASSAVRSVLGDHFVHATTVYTHGKARAIAAGAAEDTVHVAYFSYTNNATIDVVIEAGEVVSVQSLAAATYQPEPTRAERTHAIALARAYFAAQGETHVYELRGFVIMAYQPQGTTGFYDSRVLYVTFHESLEERPEYVAWVDLSHETVRKAFQEQWSNDETTGATGSTEEGQ
ncbi:MAG: hypothetical protein R2932_35210 [Caldilineaceae bacterium]